MDPLIEKMQDTFRKQRDACLRRPYPGIGERKADLKALKGLLQRYQDLIPAAISADFGGRAPAESKLVEVVGPVMEINHALASLARWMKPRRRHTEWVFTDEPGLGRVPAQGRGRRDRAVEFSALSLGRSARCRARRRQPRDDQDVRVHAADHRVARPDAEREVSRGPGRGVRRRARGRAGVFGVAVQSHRLHRLARSGRARDAGCSREPHPGDPGTGWQVAGAGLSLRAGRRGGDAHRARQGLQLRTNLRRAGLCPGAPGSSGTIRGCSRGRVPRHGPDGAGKP